MSVIIPRSGPEYLWTPKAVLIAMGISMLGGLFIAEFHHISDKIRGIEWRKDGVYFPWAKTPKEEGNGEATRNGAASE